MVAVALRHAFPLAVLLVWLALTVLVTAVRLLLRARFARMPPQDLHGVRSWARGFCIGSFAAGALWGAIALALIRYGEPRDYLFLTLITAGMSAGSLVSQSAWLPALLSYVVPLVLSMAAACLMKSDSEFVATGWLMLVYLGVVVAVGRNMNRAIVRTLGLGIDNETLHQSLTAALVERDDARAEKWNTLAQLSHELRTPLNAVVGFSHIMQEQTFGPLGHEKYRDYVGHIQTSSGYLLKLANQILAFAQGESGALGLVEEEVDLRALLADCRDMVAGAAEQAGVALTVSAAPELPRLRGDATKLKEVVLNLASNAIKFTPQGGRVALEAAFVADGRIELAVSDTGIGMREADIPRALKPFVRIASALTHKTDGAGLGLSICKRLVELHGAELAVTSAVGKGTTCRVRFPATRTVTRHALATAAA